MNTIAAISSGKLGREPNPPPISVSGRNRSHRYFSVESRFGLEYQRDGRARRRYRSVKPSTAAIQPQIVDHQRISKLRYGDPAVLTSFAMLLWFGLLPKVIVAFCPGAVIWARSTRSRPIGPCKLSSERAHFSR